MKNIKKDNTFIFALIMSIIIHIIVFNYVVRIDKIQDKKLKNNSDFNFTVSYAVKKNKPVQTVKSTSKQTSSNSKSKVASTVKKITKSNPKQNIKSSVYKKKEKKRVFASKTNSFNSAKYREELRKKYLPKQEKKYSSDIPKYSNTDVKKDEDLKQKDKNLNPNIEVLTGNENQTEPFNEISQIDNQEDEYDEQNDNLIIPDVESLSSEGRLSILPALSEEITRKKAIQIYEENNAKLSKDDLKKVVFVLTSFNISDSGNPKDIKFISKSGSEQVDSAISNLVSLMTFSNDKKYLPILIFANESKQKNVNQHLKNTIQLKKVDNSGKNNTIQIPHK